MNVLCLFDENLHRKEQVREQVPKCFICCRVIRSFSSCAMEASRSCRETIFRLSHTTLLARSDRTRMVVIDRDILAMLPSFVPVLDWKQTNH